MRTTFEGILMPCLFLLVVFSPSGWAVAQCESLAYIPNQTDNNISVIDTASRSVIATIPAASSPQSLAVAPNGKTVYVFNNIGDIFVIDTLTNSIVDTISTTRVRGGAVLSDSSELYVSNINVDTVSVIDTSTNTITDTIPTGDAPNLVAAHPDGSTVYVTIQNTAGVTVIDTATKSVTTTIPVGSIPLGITVTPDGSEVWAANFVGDTISVISTATNSVIATIPALDGPSNIDFSPDGSKAYVTVFNDSEVAVINTSTRTVSTRIPLSIINPQGIQVHPDGATVYVCASSSSQIELINTFTNTVVDSISVGSAPSSLGTFITPRRNVTPLQRVFLDFGQIGVPTDLSTQDVFGEDGEVLMILEKGFRSGFDPEDLGYAPGTDRNVLIRRIADQVEADFISVGGMDLDICFDARTPNAGDFATVSVVDGVAPIMNVANSAVVVDVSQNRLTLNSGAGDGYSIRIEDGLLRRPDDSVVPGVSFPGLTRIQIDALGASQFLDKGNTSLGGLAWVFVSAHNVSGIPDENLAELANSISHELGHLLGIEHADGEANSIMAPTAVFGTDKGFSNISRRKLAESLPPLPPVPAFLGAGNRLRIAKIGDTDQHGTSIAGPLGGGADAEAEATFREGRALLQAQADLTDGAFEFELADILQSGPEDGLYTDIAMPNGTLASYSLDLVEPGLDGTYVGARIEFGLLNVADTLGGASDFRVFVDGMELVGALDGLDQRLVAPEFAGYARGERVTLYLDDFLTIPEIDLALFDGILDVDLDVNGATSFVSVDSVIALVTDEGPRAVSQCGLGTINLGVGARADTLLINGTTGGSLRMVNVDEGTLLWAGMLLPPAGGNGRFVVHMNPGEPTNQSLTPLPGGIGTGCFKMVNASPLAVWNNIGKTDLVGESNYFKNPISDPAPAPTIFLQLTSGDTTFLPVGTVMTMQGVIIDPASLSSRGASLSNAIVLTIE